MRKVALFSKEDQQVIFSQTALKLNINPSIVEKDFWVCFMLDHLFHTCAYNKAFVFKGGTSLSKSYHVVERFSEDIDLILIGEKSSMIILIRGRNVQGLNKICITK